MKDWFYQTIRLFSQRLYANRLHALVIFIAFTLFLLNALGLYEISVAVGMRVHLAEMSAFFSTANVALSERGFILLVVNGLVLSLFLPLLSPMKGSSLIVLLAFVTFLVEILGTPIKQSIPFQYNLIVILVLYGIHILFSYFKEVKSKNAILDVFGRYIPPQLVSELQAKSSDVSLEGEAKVLTIFFCDIENFTSVSEKLTPKQLTQLLNNYFDVLTEIIFKHGGTIDKYIGDSIMAFWGAPLPCETQEQNAVLASLEMQKVIRKLADESNDNELPTPNIGIGLNTGLVSVGNMGSKYRLAYTVVGDPVNLAARLEAQTRNYKVPIIIGEKTFDALENIECRELDTIKVKGKTEESKIFQPLFTHNNADDKWLNNKSKHESALNHYYAGETKLAHDIFKELSNIFPKDEYYSVMLGKTLYEN